MSVGKLQGILSMCEALKKYDIIQAETIYEFPNRGCTYKLYVSISENAVYMWNEKDSKYYCIGRDYNEIGKIDGGNA